MALRRVRGVSAFAARTWRGSSAVQFGFQRRYMGSISRTCLCGEVQATHVGSTVDLWGWVDSVRPSGSQLLFSTLKDYTGSVQLVFQDDLVPQIEQISEESVVWVRGHVRERPTGTENEKQDTGSHEVILTLYEPMRSTNSQFSV